MEQNSFPLYSEECTRYLRLALTQAESETQEDDFRRFYEPTDEQSYSSEEDKGTYTSEDDDESSSSEEEQQDKSDAAVPRIDTAAAAANKKEAPKKQSHPAAKQPQGLNDKQKEATKRQLGRPPCTVFGLPDDNSHVLELPVALLTKEERLSNPVIQLQAYLTTATALGSSNNNKPTLLLLLRSGRFAGALFSGPKCLQHTTSTRYTIRKGQGKAQSAQDGKRKPKSVGSQLRRQGEEALRQDVKAFLQRLDSDAIGLILLSCPKTMMKSLFEDNRNVLPRGDPRLKKIPLDVGRPTFEAAVAVYEIMMQVTIREKTLDLPVSVELPTVVEAPEEETKTIVIAKPQEIIPLTPLHQHAAAANLSELVAFLESHEDDCHVNLPAGDDFMTPLHFAAAAAVSDDITAAAACVTALLVQAAANPCILDARQRPPYFCASHDKVREAFRLARATLGEEVWAWDGAAKVGPPVTLEHVQHKKKKAADKKKRQKARQKEQKARERAVAEEAEKQRRDEEERQTQQQEAKRIRDGLAPKTSTATNVCDFCQKRCKNKRRNQMLQRLEYAYCSTACVQSHKRELMAAAATARFGG